MKVAQKSFEVARHALVPRTHLKHVYQQRYTGTERGPFLDSFVNLVGFYECAHFCFNWSFRRAARLVRVGFLRLGERLVVLCTFISVSQDLVRTSCCFECV